MLGSGPCSMSILLSALSRDTRRRAVPKGREERLLQREVGLRGGGDPEAGWSPSLACSSLLRRQHRLIVGQRVHVYERGPNTVTITATCAEQQSAIGDDHGARVSG